MTTMVVDFRDMFPEHVLCRPAFVFVPVLTRQRPFLSFSHFPARTSSFSPIQATAHFPFAPHSPHAHDRLADLLSFTGGMGPVSHLDSHSLS